WIEGAGNARLLDWSPNRATVQVTGASAGALLVYNMNYDEGWRADVVQADGARPGTDSTRDVGAVLPLDDAVATRLPEGDARITLSYRPPRLGAGIMIGALAMAVIVVLVVRERRERRGQLE